MKKVIVRGTQSIFSPWFEHSLFFFLVVCINYSSLPIRFAPPVLPVHPGGKNSGLTPADKGSEKSVSVGV